MVRIWGGVHLRSSLQASDQMGEPWWRTWLKQCLDPSPDRVTLRRDTSGYRRDLIALQMLRNRLLLVATVCTPSSKNQGGSAWPSPLLPVHGLD